MEWDVLNNDEYQLTDAAAALSMNVPSSLIGAYEQSQGEHPPVGWSSEIWIRMIKKPYKDRVIIASALLAAEVDRIDEIARIEAQKILNETLV